MYDNAKSQTTTDGFLTKYSQRRMNTDKTKRKRITENRECADKMRNQGNIEEKW